MRASTARLMNSPVRLADLTFPQVNRLIHRTRLAFIHLDNLLAFAKRDRDGRVDGYITAYLPEECLLLFFRKGEAVNAASLDTTGRQVITITEALKRMRAEVERSEEHTSELQSPCNLVCRLLLEKKKTRKSVNSVHD